MNNEQNPLLSFASVNTQKAEFRIQPNLKAKIKGPLIFHYLLYLSIYNNLIITILHVNYRMRILIVTNLK